MKDLFFEILDLTFNPNSVIVPYLLLGGLSLMWVSALYNRKSILLLSNYYNFIFNNLLYHGCLQLCVNVKYRTPSS